MFEKNNQIENLNDNIYSNNDENLKKKQNKSIRQEAFEWIFCALIAYGIYLILNFYIFSIPLVKQVSMYPTVKPGERVFVNNNKIQKRELKRFDIVIFEAPTDSYMKSTVLDGKAKYIEYKNVGYFIHNIIGFGKISYIKRVIGLPGDHLQIKDDGYIYINDQKLEEKYLVDITPINMGPYTDLIVPDSHYFLIGDNRDESKDCRWFGSIPKDRIEGIVEKRIWPLNKFGNI